MGIPIWKLTMHPKRRNNTSNEEGRLVGGIWIEMKITMTKGTRREAMRGRVRMNSLYYPSGFLRK